MIRPSSERERSSHWCAGCASLLLLASTVVTFWPFAPAGSLSPPAVAPYVQLAVAALVVLVTVAPLAGNGAGLRMRECCAILTGSLLCIGGRVWSCYLTVGPCGSIMLGALTVAPFIMIVAVRVLREWRASAFKKTIRASGSPAEGTFGQWFAVYLSILLLGSTVVTFWPFVAAGSLSAPAVVSYVQMFVGALLVVGTLVPLAGNCVLIGTPGFYVTVGGLLLTGVGVFVWSWDVKPLRAIWIAPGRCAVIVLVVLAALALMAVAARLHLDWRASAFEGMKEHVCTACGEVAGCLFCASCGTNSDPRKLATSVALLYSRRWIAFTGLIVAGSATVLFASYRQEELGHRDRQDRFQKFVKGLAEFRAPLISFGTNCGWEAASVTRDKKLSASCVALFDEVNRNWIKLSWYLPALRADLTTRGPCEDRWQRDAANPLIRKACDQLENDETLLGETARHYRRLIDAYAAVRRPPSAPAEAERRARDLGEAAADFYWATRSIACLLSYAGTSSPRTALRQIYPYCDEVVSSEHPPSAAPVFCSREEQLDWAAWFAPPPVGAWTEQASKSPVPDR